MTDESDGPRRADSAADAADTADTGSVPAGAGSTSVEQAEAVTEGSAANETLTDAAVKKAPVKKAPVKKAPVKKAPVEKAPVEKAAVKKAAVKKAPVKKAAVKKAAVKNAPAENAAVVQAAVKTAAVHRAPVEDALDDASLEAVPVKKVSDADRVSRAEELEAEAARLREEQAAAEAVERKAARQRAKRAGVGPERPGAAGAKSARARPRNGWLIASVALAALLVLTLVLGGIFYVKKISDRDDRIARTSALDSARDTALASATSYAKDFGSYDYRHLPADFAKVTTHLTPQFAKSYKASSEGLAATIVKYRGKSTAAVQGVAVSSATTTTAEILIFLDQTVTTAQSNTPRIDRNRLQMSLVRKNGTWLIDQLMLK